MASFPSIRIEGGLLGSELLDQVIAADVLGQKPADFGLEPKRNLTDEIAAVFADSRALWGVFQNRLARLPEDDVATTTTRKQWVEPFLGLLGYNAQPNPRAYEVDGQTFAVSHRATEAEDSPPIHIVGARQELGRVPATGRPRLAPHSLVQEYLNRTEHVWGIVTNGITLRLLRDSTLVRRQAYVEFDLQAIFEEQRFPRQAHSWRPPFYKTPGETQIRGSGVIDHPFLRYEIQPVHASPRQNALRVSLTSSGISHLATFCPALPWMLWNASAILRMSH